MTSGSQLVPPSVLLHGCDGFEPVIYLKPVPGHSLAYYADAMRTVLVAGGLRPRRGRWSPQGAKRSIRLPWGTINLQALPQGVLQAWAYSDPVCLRRDLRGTADAAREALKALWAALPHREAGTPPHVGVKSMTAHADVVGLDLHASMVPGDFLNLTRTRLRSWHEEGRLTGITVAGGAITLYDKTALIRSRRSDADRDLMACCRALGYEDSMGTLWRLEAAYSAALCRRYGIDTLEAVFRHALSRLVLLQPGEKGVPKAGRAVHPAWALLDGLRFASPWEAPCAPPPVLAEPPDMAVRKALGVAIRALARLTALLGIVVGKVEDAVVHAVLGCLARWPSVQEEFRDHVVEFRTRYGRGVA